MVAPAVGLFEQGQLGARVGFLPAADDAQVGGSGRELVAVGVFAQQGGELDDAGRVESAWLAVGVEHVIPGGRGDAADRGAFPAAEVPADAVVHPISGAGRPGW